MRNSISKVFLNKDWILNETADVIRIIPPDLYFQKQSSCDAGIFFARKDVTLAITLKATLVLTIDLKKEYQIVTFNFATAKIELESILGQQLHQKLKEITKENNQECLNEKQVLDLIQNDFS